MTEPTSAVTAAAVSGSVITIVGLSTGLPAEMIMPAFAGALWALLSVPEGRPVVRVGQVFVGTLLAAWSAHPLAAIAVGMLPAAVTLPPDALRYPVAFCIGWGGLSIGLKWVGRMFGGSQP